MTTRREVLKGLLGLIVGLALRLRKEPETDGVKVDGQDVQTLEGEEVFDYLNHGSAATAIDDLPDGALGPWPIDFVIPTDSGAVFPNDGTAWSFPQYRIAWESETGKTGHGQYIFSRDEAIRQADCLNEKYPSLCHWIESESPVSPVRDAHAEHMRLSINDTHEFEPGRTYLIQGSWDHHRARVWVDGETSDWVALETGTADPPPVPECPVSADDERFVIFTCDGPFKTDDITAEKVEWHPWSMEEWVAYIPPGEKG